MRLGLGVKTLGARWEPEDADDWELLDRSGPRESLRRGLGRSKTAETAGRRGAAPPGPEPRKLSFQGSVEVCSLRPKAGAGSRSLSRGNTARKKLEALLTQGQESSQRGTREGEEAACALAMCWGSRQRSQSRSRRQSRTLSRDLDDFQTSPAARAARIRKSPRSWFPSGGWPGQALLAQLWLCFGSARFSWTTAECSGTLLVVCRALSSHFG